MLELKSLRTVNCILSGVGAMHMMRKGQLHQRVKSARNEAEFIHKLFGLVV
ncbi:Transposase [Bacillus cereus F65185]|nr:Transposase [Bacillus cereus F65185]